MGRFYIDGNPFNIASFDYKMVGRPKERQQIIDRIEASLKENSCKFLLILGDYGFGKSFTLEQLYDDIYGKETYKQIFAIRPSSALIGTLYRAMESEPAFSKFGVDFVTRLFSHIEKERLFEVATKANLNSKLINSDSKKLFKLLKDKNEDAYRVLTGDIRAAKDISKIGLTRGMKDAPAALGFLHNFQIILRSAGYKALLIMLDEFEYILNTEGEKKITRIFNTFKGIYDDFSSFNRRFSDKLARIIFIFAITPGGWNRFRDLTRSAYKKTGGGGIVPFYERINQRDIINLSPLTPKETEELVKTRLAPHRSKDAPKQLVPTYPFDTKLIHYICDKEQGIPRKILQDLNIVLEEAGERKLNKITLKFGKEIIEKYFPEAEEKKG